MHSDEAPRNHPDGGPTWMPAILDLLLTVAYIDGLFHRREQRFLQHYIDSVIVLVDAASPEPSAEHMRIRAGYRSQIGALYDRLSAEIGKLGAEVMSSGDTG